MESEKLMRGVLLLDLLILGGTGLAIYFLTSEQASNLYLYELLGVLTGSAITLFGIRQMKLRT